MENILEKMFSPGHSLQIIFSKHRGKVETVNAIVKDVKDEGLFVTAKEVELTNLLEQGSEITIHYESNDGKQYLFSTYKIAHVSHESPVLILAKPWKINFPLVRRFFGSEVVLPWKVNFAVLRRYFRVKVELPFYLVERNVHIGQITDLSIGGLFAVVSADPMFVPGAHIRFQLKIPNLEPFKLKGEIVRTETIEETKLGMGIHFLNATEEIRMEISQYLLQCREGHSEEEDEYGKTIDRF